MNDSNSALCSSNNKTRWGIVSIAICAGVIGAMQVGKVASAIPIIEAELAIGRVTAGWVVSLILAAGAFLGPICGIVGDRVGHRSFLLFGLFIMFLGNVLGGFSPNASYLLASRLIEGFGFLAIVIAAPSIIVSITSTREVRLALGAWGAYMPVGISLIMVLAPFLVDEISWRGLWLVNAIVLFVFLIIFAKCTRGLGGASVDQTSIHDIKIAFSQAGPWLLAGCFAVFACQFIGLISWLPTYFVEDVGYGAAQSGIIVACVVVFNAFGNMLGGWFLRLVRRSTLIAITSGSLGLIAVITFWPDMPGWAVIVLSAIFSFIGGFIPAAALTGVPRYAISSAQIGVTNGIVVQGANVGALIGPPVIAVSVTVLGGWHMASWVILSLGIVGVIIALALRFTE